MKRYLIYILGLLIYVGLTSCNTDDQGNNKQEMSSGLIRFSLDKGQTLTRSVAAENREKTINSDAVYVVAFKKNGGTLVAAVKATTTDDINFIADLGQSGLYDIYVIANADATLASLITGLSASATYSSLCQLVATQVAGTSLTGDIGTGWDPNADGYFLMTGKNPETNKQGPQGGDDTGTLLTNPISMSRVAVRIDVDASGATFTITDVQLNKKYTESLLIRNTTGMGTLACSANSGLTGLSTQNLTAAFYTYENTDADSEIIIKGTTVKGENQTITIPFNMALVRNHCYKVTLTSESTDPMDKLDYSIYVKDWDGAETLKVQTGDANITSDVAPSIVKLELDGSDVGNVTTVTGVARSGGIITVTVNNPGSTQSKIVCTNMYEGFNLGNTTYDARRQIFTINIDTNGTGSPRTFNFSIENMHDNSLKTNFTVTQLDS